MEAKVAKLDQLTPISRARGGYSKIATVNLKRVSLGILSQNIRQIGLGVKAVGGAAICFGPCTSCNLGISVLIFIHRKVDL